MKIYIFVFKSERFLTKSEKVQSELKCLKLKVEGKKPRIYTDFHRFSQLGVLDMQGS